jgi:LDH2 family malate/lactate/ureidoglycolate dehydrogenase
MTTTIVFAPDELARQLNVILQAWGMPPDQSQSTVDIMMYADLRGIESHGLMMLPLYDDFRRAGRLNMAPTVKTVRDRGATVLIDGDGGLGHYPSQLAMRAAIQKASSLGVGVASVRNSNHYGPAGAYAGMAAEHGLLGLSVSAVYRPGIVPTGGKVPMLGTNPIALAAPAKRNQMFSLDMSTSTAAVGKIKLAKLHSKPLPSGWAVDEQGAPITDADEGLRIRYLTPLGSNPVLSSHKGYGLATMVEVLSTVLSGSSFAPTRDRLRPGVSSMDVGHFFMAIDPSFFREPGEFEDDMDALMEALRLTPAIDPAKPVQVAGDPEHREFQKRSAHGVPVATDLVEMLRQLAKASSADFFLEAIA